VFLVVPYQPFARISAAFGQDGTAENGGSDLLYTQEVGGSSPSPPTSKINGLGHPA